MIFKNEIKQKARVSGVPVSTIERDYAQNWILKYLSQIDMVLKGGTGIRKAYIEDYRFSDDLDFTLFSKITPAELKRDVKESVEKAREKSGIDFTENIEFQENDNGYEFKVSFQIAQRGTSITKIKIDITKSENEKILLPVNIKKIIHPYSDDLNAKVKVYAFEEIMAEKIRSLFQRTRPRDLYDVWCLWDKLDIEKVFKILPQKFRVKDAEMNIKNFERRKDDFKNAWETSLTHQLKDLPNFEGMFLKVVEIIRLMEKKVWEL